MKLLLCKKCRSIFNLSKDEEKTCFCGETKGKYVDDINAKYEGPCFPIGFDNNSLINALKNQPKNGLGERFDAFVIPKSCPTMKKKKTR